jgi:HEPN domain-containing protein
MVQNQKQVRKIIGYTHQQQLDNADLWYQNSLTFNAASSILHEYKDHIIGGLRVYQFNAGLSLELILKAIIVAKGELIPQTHNLRELCSKADVTLSKDQEFTLDLLTESIVWLGKYPAPKSEGQWDNYHDNILEKQKVRERSSHSHITKANPKRFPSQENYMRIWSVFLAKYSSITKISEHE